LEIFSLIKFTIIDEQMLTLKKGYSDNPGKITYVKFHLQLCMMPKLASTCLRLSLVRMVMNQSNLSIGIID
jgi:hypothetical protein